MGMGTATELVAFSGKAAAASAVEPGGAILTAPSSTFMGHPKGLFILFFTEMWERFSYYGMRALLMIYMIEALHYNTRQAGTIYGMYQGLVFFTPVFGGYLADRYLGQRRAIALGAVLMAIGHFTMMFAPLPMFYLALGILVLGNGFFKPNISVIVGQLYEENDPRRDGAFSIFYMGINLGAFLSPFICGTLGQRVGWHYGFGAAGVGMVVGLGIYAMGQKWLGDHGLHPMGASSPSAPRTALGKVEKQRLGVLLVLALLGNVVFWAAFEQAGSSMALFAEHATRLHVGWLNFTVPSSWFQSANPLFIAALAPLFSWLWVRLSRARLEPATPLKFALGMVLVAAGFGAMMMAGRAYDLSGPVSMNWLLIAFLLNTCGELCVSPVGLSAVTKLAPRWLTSAVMGLWFGSMAIGNWASGKLAGEYDSMSKAEFFSVPMIVAGLTAIVLLILARPLRKMTHGIH